MSYVEVLQDRNFESRFEIMNVGAASRVATALPQLVEEASLWWIQHHP